MKNAIVAFLIASLLPVTFSCKPSAGKRKTSARKEIQRKVDKSAYSLNKIPVPGEAEMNEAAPVTIAARPEFTRMTKKATVFLWNNTCDTVLLCEEGTKLVVPRFAFVRRKDRKPVKGMIRLKVREFYRLSDQLAARLTTVSGNRLLETGGMVQIEAFNDNEPLELAEGTEMVIGFPATEKQPDMQIFYGNRNAAGRMSWIVQEPEKPVDYSAVPKGVFIDPEVQAQFPGGMSAMRKFISENLVYPQSAIDKEIEGKVFLRFVVSESGSIHNVEIARGLDPELDQAAANVVRSMPDWIPASINGKYMQSTFNLPISFSIEGEDKPKTPQELEKRRKMLEDFHKRQVGNETLYTMLSSAKLGWINCDRFVEAENNIDLVIDAGEYNGNASVSLVFKRIHSVLPLYRSNKGWLAEAIPANERATVVVVAEKGGKQYVALKEIITEAGIVRISGFKAATDEEIAVMTDKIRK